MNPARSPTAWPLLCLSLSAVVGWLAWSSLHAICFRVPPAALAASERPVRPPSAQPSAHPERVVLVVLDGLRLDVSRQMPFLNQLRARGVDAVALAPEPSLSRPGYANMATGAPPERTGVRNNAFPWEVELDTIFDRAHGAGLRTSGVANLSWWHENFRRGIDTWLSAVGQPLDATELTVERSLAAGSELSLVHLANLDHIAHTQGVGDEYRSEASRVDALLARSLAALDLRRSALLVTSDHGHRDRGGHGGPEPEVVKVPLIAAGLGVRQGAKLDAEASLGNVGPTIATLLGIELPRDSLSDPLWPLLDPGVLGASYLEARAADAAAQHGEYARRLARRAPTAERSGLAALLPFAPAEFPGSLPARGLALLWMALGVALVGRALRRGMPSWPLVLSASIALGPWLALRAFDLPWSLSAIVRVSFLVTVLTGGVVAGTVTYLAALRRWVPDVRVARFHARSVALAHLSLAPLLWLGFGYRHPLHLPAPLLLFAPLVAALTGAVSATLLALAEPVLWRVRSPVPPGE